MQLASSGEWIYLVKLLMQKKTQVDANELSNGFFLRMVVTGMIAHSSPAQTPRGQVASGCWW
jgi:hypothetical protein